MKQIYRQKETLKKELPLFYTYGILALLGGLFLSTFDILVHAKFLEVLGYKYLATSYILAGAIGVVITFQYSRLFQKIHTKTLNIELITLILICVGSYLIVGLISPSRINAYIGMVLLFPVNILFLLTLWRFSRKMLMPQQSKDLIPKIKLFHLAGLAIGGFLTTLSLYAFYSFTFISIFSLIVLILYWFCQIYLFKIHGRSNLFNSENEKYVPVKNNIFLFFTSPIASNLYLFGLLSAIVGFSIHFTFINIAAAGFQNIIGLSKFYGLFTAVLIMFIFGVDKFLIRRILYSYDSPYSLILIPFILLIAVVITIGAYHFLSKYNPYKSYSVFFLLLSIVKVASESTRIIIQAPSLRALFQTLDIRYRQVVYPHIEGTAVMFGLLLSGIVILPITFLKFFTLNIILYWTAIVSIAWIFVGIRLIKLYKKEQTKSLEQLRYNKTQGLVSENSYKERLWKTLTGNDIIKIERLLNILSEIRPIVYEDYLDRLLAHHNNDVKNLIIKRIVKERIIGLIPKLQKKTEEASSPDKELLLHVIDDLKFSEVDNKNIEELRDILFSGNVSERLELASSLNNSNIKGVVDILFELAKDVEPEVHQAALKSLARKENPRFNYSLLDFLYPEKYNPYIIRVIANSGEDAIDYLEREQMLSETPAIVLIRIIKIMGLIGNEKAIDIIISNITNQDRYVQLHSIQALIDSQFQANNKNRYKLINLVVKQIGVITQNLHYYKFLFRKPKCKVLAEAYRQEVNFNYDLLFKFLSIIYNPHIIASLKNIFLDGNHSQVNHGIELADQYIDEDIKHVLFPLLEDIDIDNRLKRLEHYFVQPKINTAEIIRASLTQDYKTLSLFPRTSAMMHILHNNMKAFEDELVFNVYHSELLLSETAAFVLSKIHPETLNNLLNEEGSNKNLEQLILNVENINEEDLLHHRFAHLNKYTVFNKFSEYVALQLAQHTRKVLVTKNQAFDISNLKGKEGLILSDLPVFKGDNNCVISCSDNLMEIDLLINNGITNIIPEYNTELWLFSKHIIKELLYDQIDFTDIYFNVIENIRISSN